MSCKVKATVTLGDCTAEEIFSVRQYAEQVLDPTSSYSNNTVLVDLVKKLLDYGTKAQTVFDINTSEPANADVDYTMEDVTAKTMETVISGDSTNEGKTQSDMKENTSDFGLKYQYSTLVLLSKTSLRHYYLVENQSVYDSAKEELQGAAYSERKLPSVYFEFTDIPAYELAKYQTFTIGGQTYQFSALDYFRNVLESHNVSNEMKDIAKSSLPVLSWCKRLF